MRLVRQAIALGGVAAMLAVLGGLCGCSRGAGAETRREGDDVPVVPVSVPVQREVTDYVEFTGRTVAVEAVDVRARVTGYLVGMPFKEGAEVKKGDVLFEIDPRPYQAMVDQAEAQVELDQAQQKVSAANLERAKKLIATNTITQQELDETRALLEEAEARVKADQANAAAFRLNLDFARVQSPINGQVSRYYLTLGNLVSQDQTLLTTVVSLDPLYVYFEMDEPTLLMIRRAVSEGRIPSPTNGEYPLQMSFQGEEGFPHTGKVNFINNQVEPTTGSVSVRGVFPNPKSSDGARLLSPGMFARVRLPLGGPHPALLVIDRAIGSDQGLKYVYVVDAESKIQYRRIATGALQEDGLRVVTGGLQPDDVVVVGRLPQLRAKMAIKVDRVAMPSLGAPASDGTTPSQNGAANATSEKSGDAAPNRAAGTGEPASSPIAPEKTGAAPR